MKILKIGAVWCNGCLVMRPRWQQIEEENPELDTQYYDFDQNPDIAQKYNIEAGVLPCFIFLNSAGEEIARLQGEVSKDEIMKVINSHKDGKEYDIPEGKFIVMGDNREMSTDSREWGFLDRKYLVGKAFVIYWPIDKIRVI